MNATLCFHPPVTSRFDSETSDGSSTIYDKLTRAFGELSENMPLVIAYLPSDVKQDLIGADGDEAVKKIWEDYLRREVSYLEAPSKDEVDKFQAMHGHRYTQGVNGVLGGE